jgi:Tol biopolymer transport system component
MPAEPDGSNTNRTLTNGASWKAGAYVENSAISPDNRYVAYVWHTINPGSNEVRLVPADGRAAPRTLHHIEGGGYVDPLEWTPDGKHLLVVSSRGDRASYQIGMLSVQDGTVRGIKSLGWVYPVPKLSPDGRYIGRSPTLRSFWKSNHRKASGASST